MLVHKCSGTHLARQPEDVTSRAGSSRRCKWRTYQKCLCRSEIPEQRTVLLVDLRCDQGAVVARREARTKIVLALVIGRNIAPKQSGLGGVMDRRSAAQFTNQRHEKQEGANIG